MNIENKNSYFVLDLRIPDLKIGNKEYKSLLTNSVDLILASMGSLDETDQFVKEDGSRIIYFFKTNIRKRKGQLVKFCERHLPPEQTFKTEGITKDYLQEQKIRLEQTHRFHKESEKVIYQGNDIEILNDRKNWKPWQVDIFNKFFNEDLSIKPSNEREIYSIIDVEGQGGKSIFFKWIYVHVGADKVGAITFGNASQLRTSIYNLGEKKMYILDLTRTKGEGDREEDLMSALEATKNGMVTTSMYEKGETLLMEPPHILITSNYLLEYELLSMDRWKIYELKTNGELGKENVILKDKSERRRILKRQKELAKERQSVKKL